jgi:diguanylate cyclase (GGDEF)-like protein/PAS domain S-box-containing protein
MYSLRRLAVDFEPARPGDSGESIYHRFKGNPDCPLIAVIDDKACPIGLVERNSFLVRLAGPYGRSVYGERPISLIMESAPLLVEADTDSGVFARYALEGFSGQLIKGFIVVDQGRYLGVGAILDLLKATVAERAVNEQQLRVLAENLRKSNLDAERQRRFAEAVIEHIPSLVTVRSETDGVFVLANKAGEAILGLDRSEIVGKTVAEISPRALGRQLQSADKILSRLPPATIREIPFDLHDAGDARLLRIAQIPVAMPDDDSLILTVADDVTEASQAISRIEQLAHYDILTGLPNRAAFQEKLAETLGIVDRSGEIGVPIEAALLIIDIDRFKSVNDLFGHSLGDAVLREVAERLRSVIEPEGMPTRLGGDEFAALITARGVEAMAESLAQRLTELLAQPFLCAGRSVQLGGSVGIAVYPRDASRAEDLIQHADMALYRAKAEGKSTWRRFNAGMQASLLQKNQLEYDLRNALAKGELGVHFQPIRDLASERITGFEALMRWDHPRLGAVSPASFIPIAEESGMIGPMGEWIFRQACAMACRLPDGMTIAVNISAVQFGLPGFVGSVIHALAASGLEPHRLEIEVTESVFIHDEAQVLRIINLLRDLGVRIALDDFGTGFASLSYLHRLPFDKIKIDMSFVQGLPGNTASTAIIGAVSRLARELGMITTAEGVETPEQLAAVTALGCTQAQGYLIGHPVADPQAFLPVPPASQKVA